MKYGFAFSVYQECNEIDMLILLQQVTEGQLIKHTGKKVKTTAGMRADDERALALADETWLAAT